MVKDVVERELKTNEKLGHLQEWYYWKKPGLRSGEIPYRCRLHWRIQKS